MKLLNEGCVQPDIIVTEPQSAPTIRCIFGFYKVGADEPGIEPEKIEDFSFICRKVLEPGGYAFISGNSL